MNNEKELIAAVKAAMFFILAKGKRVRFEQKRNAPMKRAMQLMQAARGKKGGDHNAGKKSH